MEPETSSARWLTRRRPIFPANAATIDRNSLPTGGARLRTLLSVALIAALGACGAQGVTQAPGDGTSQSRRELPTPAQPRPDARPNRDWPRFLGPTVDSKSPETGLLTEWAPAGPEIVWHCPLGVGYGIGSVAGGKFFQFDRHGDRARLTALEADSGRALWNFEYATRYEDMLGYNNGPRCSPVIDGDRIYLYGPEGMLHCISTEGREIWKVDTARRFGVVQNFFGVGSTPLVEGNRLLVMVGGSPAESDEPGRFDMDRVKANGTCVVAFDKRNGQVQYTVGDDLASYASLVAATIQGRRWCFAFARSGLVAFNPETGKADFQYPWRSRLHDSVNASTPVVVGNEVFISECYGPGSSLLRVRPGGYDVVWRDPPGRDFALKTHWNTPIHHEGYLYGSSGRHSGDAELRCVEWTTGRVIWRQRGLRRASLLYVDGHLICLGEDGVLRLIRATPDGYRELAKVVLRERPDGQPLLKPPAWAAPVLAGGLLYVRGDDRLVCLRVCR